MNNDVLTVVQNFLKGIKKGRANPHRFALLLAIATLFDKSSSHENKFHIDDELEEAFQKAFRSISPKTPATSIQIEYPFYHLQGSGLWILNVKKGKEEEYQEIILFKNARFTKKRLLQLISHASLNDDMIQIMRNEAKRKEFVDRLKDSYEKMTQTSKSSSTLLENIKPDSFNFSNPFVGYLNSLQQVGGSNENALAESQVCNENFALLHVAHPLVQTILAELRDPSGRHIILTGHAGDGKSTLAIDVLKHLKGLPPEAPLPAPIGPREEVDSANVTIIKDLSEQNQTKKYELINELVENKKRFLLVSNTGTLLDLFKSHKEMLTPENGHLESCVLETISSDTGGADLDLKGTRFKIFNLARMDNLALARQIFERMLNEDRWIACSEKECRATCPICINVDLIRKNKERVLDRIFLAYRRMYEYGIRLTLRQLTEHLAYMLTSGLEGSDIRILQEKAHRPLTIEFLFFNRFFGDNGAEADMAAIRMKSVKAVLDQGFGERPSPVWEHRLWLKTYGQALPFNVAGCEKVFETLRDQGSRIQGKPNVKISPDRAREQVRRMLYFLYDFKDKDNAYIGQFLNSPSLLNWMDWQASEGRLKPRETTGLGQKVYHVLQEHFTGVRLPEGSSQGGDRRLYITLSRPRQEVRQSAQIVLAELDWSTATHLELKEKIFANGQQRKDLVLRGKEPIKDIDLDLGVPFLDYVLMRHFGEFGEVLQAAYIERLDQYKARLQGRIGRDEAEEIMLVHLKTDHTFLRQQYSVTKGTLEVNDVL
jgi:hypothetical protein